MGLDDYLKPIISVASAYVGWQIGGPVGGVIGWGLGMGIGGALFPPEAEKTTAQSMGPAQALMPQSNYGGVVPVLFGTRRIAGNLIWHNQPTATSSQEAWNIAAFIFHNTNYDEENLAVVSFAYGICIGPATITRIYNGTDEYVCFAGNAYQINVGENVPVEYMDQEPYDILMQLWNAGATPAFTYVEYNGTQTTADPTIVTAHGATAVPPYRNLHYAVFNNFPIKDIGADIPKLTFECCSTIINTETTETFTYFGDDDSDLIPFQCFYLLGHIYTIYTNTDYYIRKIDKVNPVTLAVVASCDLTDDDGAFLSFALQYLQADVWAFTNVWQYYPDESIIIVQTQYTILHFDAGNLSRTYRHHLGKVIVGTDWNYYVAKNGSSESNANYRPVTGPAWATFWLPVSDNHSDGYVGTWQDGYNDACWGYEDFGEDTLFTCCIYRDLYRGGFYQIPTYATIIEEGLWGREYPVSYHALNMSAVSGGAVPKKIWYSAPNYYIWYAQTNGASTDSYVFAIHRDSYSTEAVYTASNMRITGSCILSNGNIVIVGSATRDPTFGQAKMVVLDTNLGVVAGPFTWGSSGMETTCCTEYSGYIGYGSALHVVIAIRNIGATPPQDYTTLYVMNTSTGAVVDTYVIVGATGVVTSLTGYGNWGVGYVFGTMSDENQTENQFRLSINPQQYNIEDATPQDVSAEILTNEFYGEGLDPSVLESVMTAEAEAYATANDMLISVIFDQQQSVLNALQYVAQHHNGFFTVNDGQIAHRQLEIDDEVVTWATNAALSDEFSDAVVGDQWRVIGDLLPSTFALDGTQSMRITDSSSAAIESALTQITENIPSDADDGYIVHIDGFGDFFYSEGISSDMVGEYGGPYTSFYRFTSIAINQGQSIASATLKLYISSISGTFTFNVYGNDVNSAAQPTQYSDIDGATLTTEYTPVSTSTLTQGAVNNIDVTDVVQEILDRAGWSSGNNMMFIVENGDGSSEYVEIRDYYYGSGYAQLVIEY